jgi:hypothetical protein
MERLSSRYSLRLLRRRRLDERDEPYDDADQLLPLYLDRISAPIFPKKLEGLQRPVAGDVRQMSAIEGGAHADVGLDERVKVADEASSVVPRRKRQGPSSMISTATCIRFRFPGFGHDHAWQLATKLWSYNVDR